MKGNEHHKSLTFVLLVTLFSFSVADAEAMRPNIIAFYANDHVHADRSCQGVLDDIRTPHVNALAKGGVVQMTLLQSCPCGALVSF